MGGASRALKGFQVGQSAEQQAAFLLGQGSASGWGWQCIPLGMAVAEGMLLSLEGMPPNGAFTRREGLL